MSPPGHAVSSETTSTRALTLPAISSGLRQHWLFVAFLCVAIALRVIVTLAYRPALIFPDSWDYLARANDLTPMAWHPLGYSFFLRLLRPIGDITAVVVVQHLLVVFDAVLLYALLVHLGVKQWLSALGTAPVLFDAFQLNAEQWVLSEAFFETVLTVGLVILLWNAKPKLWQCAVAGLLLATAALTRFDGALVLLPALAYVLLRRAGIVRIVTVALAFVLPIVAYAGWYDAVNGEFTVSGLSGVVLYGRISQIAECKGLSLPSYERPLCPRQPPGLRPPANWYVTSFNSPARTMRAHDGHSPYSIVLSFDLTIIEHQPLDLANHVFDDFLRQYKPTHQIEAGLAEPNMFFQIGYPSTKVSLEPAAGTTEIIQSLFGGPPLSANLGLDRFLRDYQKVIFTWGPLLGVMEVLGLLAILGVGKARSSGRRAECLVLWSSGILVFLFSVASFAFQFRYLLPTIFFVPPASVLAIAMIWPRFRANTWSRRGAMEIPQPTESEPIFDLPVSEPVAS